MDITASSKHQQSLFSLLCLLYVETLEICVLVKSLIVPFILQTMAT